MKIKKGSRAEPFFGIYEAWLFIFDLFEIDIGYFVVA